MSEKKEEKEKKVEYVKTGDRFLLYMERLIKKPPTPKNKGKARAILKIGIKSYQERMKKLQSMVRDYLQKPTVYEPEETEVAKKIKKTKGGR